MPYLFDTDAISEAFRRRPSAPYLKWLATIPREDQFTSAMVVAELFEGAFRSPSAATHEARIRARVLPAVTVLPFDVATARVFGRIQAALAAHGHSIADADGVIAATALHHGLGLVTGNVRHYERVPGLRIERVLADARAR